MGTPSTRTPIRLGRGTYSNLNASKSDLLEGEVVYAHDQNKLYVKEGSNLETIQADVSGKQDADAQLTELATMGSTTAEALADLTQAEVQILDGCTRTTTQLNYVDATSSIQTQIDGKQASGSYQAADAELTELATMASGTAGALADLTQTEVEILDGATVTTAELNTLDGYTGDKDDLIYAKDLKATGVTATEFDYLDGVTSNIQTQLNAKGAGDVTLAGAQSFTGVKTFNAAAVGEVTALSDGATIATDMALSNNFSVTLGGNRTLGQPTNQAVGQSGSYFITQDGTGSRTLAYHADFKWVGGSANTPTLTTTAGAVDRIDYIVAAANKIHCVASLDVK